MLTLTRNQKIYAGVLGVALACLVADQLLLQPKDAAASIEPPTVPITPEEREIVIPEPKDTIKERIAQLAPDHDPTTTRDVFVPEWGGTTEVTTCHHQSLLETTQLNAVFAGTSGHAIIDGESLATGDRFLVFSVFEISARQVILECTEHPGTMATLKMSE